MLTRRPATAYALAIVFNLLYAAVWLYRAHRFLDASSEEGRSRSRARPVLYAIGGSLGCLFLLPYLLAIFLTARKIRAAERRAHDALWTGVPPWRTCGVAAVSYGLIFLTNYAHEPAPTVVVFGLAVATVASFWFPFLLFQRHLRPLALGSVGDEGPRRSRWVWWASPLLALYAAGSLLTFVLFSDTVHVYIVRDAQVSTYVTCNSRIVTVPMMYTLRGPQRGDTAVARTRAGGIRIGVIVGLPGDRIDERKHTLAFAGGPPQPVSWYVPPDWNETVPPGYYIMRIAVRGRWNLEVYGGDYLIGPAVLRYTQGIAAIPLHDTAQLNPPPSPACTA